MLLPRAAFGASPKPLFAPQTFREEAKKRAAGATRFLLVLHGILGEEQLGGASADAQSYWQGRFAACTFVECV